MQEDPQSSERDLDRLDGWKEIAAYLRKDVRTAIRWSKDESMPVYRHAEGKRGAIYAYRSEIDQWIHADRSASAQRPRARSRRKTVLVWVGAVTALILVAGALLLWLTSSTDPPNTPVAARPWVLITDFDNRTGEARFDGTVETALRRELANSRHVLVVAPETVRDTLALMKRAPDVAIDAGLGREICLRYGGSCAPLTGRVDKFSSSYLLSLEVVDPADGRTVVSTEEEAAGDSEVLPAVHRIGDWLREHLGEELAQIRLDDEQLEKVTTPSLRALELYSKGLQFMRLPEPRFAEAEALFRQAVEEDPGFASANLAVFEALWWNRPEQMGEAQFFLERAMKGADSASDQERYFIEASYYHHKERDYERSCRSYKTLAELFPDHRGGVINAAHTCGGTLGHREDMVRYVVQTLEQSGSSHGQILWAAQSLSLLAGDFDQARPYVGRLRDLIADGEIPGRLDSSFWGGGRTVAFTELFAAEEYLHKGLLPDVLNELQRVELARGSMDSSLLPTRPDLGGLSVHEWLTWDLVHFYLALGQFRKARELSRELRHDRLLQSWCAFLAGDQAAFREHLEDDLAEHREVWPDPTERLIAKLRWNTWGNPDAHPLDVLVPMYDAESAVETASFASEPPPAFLRQPGFQAKMQLARGRQMLSQGQPEEAIALLRRGVGWFRDRGDWITFPYYFVGAELLAIALAGQGDLLAAGGVLEDAADQRNLVNSQTAPLHQRIQARLALLSRELGRTDAADAIEAELEEALRLADQDHPILVQIREQRDLFLEIE